MYIYPKLNDRSGRGAKPGKGPIELGKRLEKREPKTLAKTSQAGR